MLEDSPKLAGLFNSLDRSAWIEIAAIAAVAVLLVRASQRALPWIANRLHGRARHYLLASVPLLRLVLIVIASGLILPIVIEPSLRNMVALLGAAGLAIGFALKDYVSSLIAGVVSAFEQPYRPGDWVELDGHYGEVVHVGMRTVSLVTVDDDTIIVPHLKLWTSAVRNANNDRPVLQCAANFLVHPQHDARRAREVLEDVALTSPFVYFDAPVVVSIAEETWGTRYTVRAYPVDPRQQYRFVSDLTVRGREALARIGAEALLPQVSFLS